MTEEEWEKMMRESDVRAARFGELLETLMDHPNGNELVAREMGWNELADAMARSDSENDPPDDADEDSLYFDESNEHDFGSDDEDDSEPFGRDEQDRELEEIPAYVLCERAGGAVDKLLKPFQSEDVKLHEDDGELIGQAWIGMHIACAKMSGGHAMGYGEDVLGGNIVNNKRGLESARQTISAMQHLAERKIISVESLNELMLLMREAEVALVARIEELRSMMWWK